VFVVFLQRSSHRRCPLLTWQEANETETARAARCRVDHHDRVGHDTEAFEMLAQLGGRRVLRQAPDEQLIRSWNRSFHVNRTPTELMFFLYCGRSSLGVGERDVSEPTRSAVWPPQDNCVDDGAEPNKVITKMKRCGLVR
jgi:hypothetical protein